MAMVHFEFIATYYQYININKKFDTIPKIFVRIQYTLLDENKY